MNELVWRRDATQKTLDAFAEARLSWGDDAPEMTCAHILHHHLLNTGHTPPEIPRFTTPKGAMRALKTLGWDSMSEMLDDLLERIPPAMMKLGDVVIAPSEGPLEAVLICAGPFKLFGLSPDDDRTARIDFNMGAIEGAWSIGETA